MAKMVIGWSNDRVEAETVVDDLVHEGVERGAIALMENPTEVEKSEAGLTVSEKHDLADLVRQGGAVVAVRTVDPEVERIQDIMNRHHLGEG